MPKPNDDKGERIIKSEPVRPIREHREIIRGTDHSGNFSGDKALNSRHETRAKDTVKPPPSDD
jgi:hypothetical protein